MWGSEYVCRFARFGLPSLLAPGNLPALAAATDLEVLLLMPEGERRELAGTPAFARLLETAPVRHLPIDDLMAANRGGVPFYGLTLTRAYWRGIADSGDAMTETRFIFMNADFVMADGSLTSLTARLAAGHRVVMASNLRCVAEDVEHPLSTLLIEDGSGSVLAIAPRDMVALALRHQHPLQLAKIVNAGLCHTAHPNQFFWQVDEGTVISHHYLYFPLCIHPERVLPTVEGFCDYAFIPELCPHAEPVVMEDSDEFCMFELQSRRSELELLRMGKATPAEIAASLSFWTTRGQREAARRHQVVFHTGPLDEKVRRVGEEARAYMRDLDGCLSPDPVGHLGHPYWIEVTNACGLAVSPSRSQPRPDAGPDATPPSLLLRVRRCLQGHAPDVPVWHPNWLDARPIAALVAATGRTDGGHTLYVHDGSHGGRGRFSEGLAAAASCTLDDVLAGRLEDRLPPQADRRLIIVEITRRHYDALRGLTDVLHPYLAPGGRIAFHLFEPTPWLSGVALAYDMRRLIGHLGSFAPLRCSLILAGGEAKRRNARLFHWMRETRRRRGILAAPVLAPLWLLTAALSVRANRALAAIQDARRPIRDVSSFTLIVEG